MGRGQAEDWLLDIGLAAWLPLGFDETKANLPVPLPFIQLITPAEYETNMIMYTRFIQYLFHSSYRPRHLTYVSGISEKSAMTKHRSVRLGFNEPRDSGSHLSLLKSM